MKALLNGIRIVDVTTIVMGPMASQTLADLGAEVVKIEAPDGDLARHSGAPGPDGMGALFANNNRNKKSLALDLRRPAGRAVLTKLIAGADVVMHNMRPKAAERLGLGPAAARAANPAVIHCAAVGFGSGGPYAGTAAYDDVIQAAAGLAALPLKVGRAPDYVPSIAADKIAALHVVYAILAALMRRERTGEGCDIEVPMFEVLAAFLFNEHLDAATFAADGAPGYSRLLNPNRRPYATKDGWIAAMPYSGGQWTRTLAELGRGEVADEAWFATAAGRNANSHTLYGILAAALPARTTDEWIEVFHRLDVPHARVNTLEDLVADPHLAAVDFFRPTDGLAGRLRSVAQPVAFAGLADAPDRAPPALGADADEILAGLGYAADEIAALRADRALA
ncbi:CaiB/BaiF CoA-transferase family protein [Acuticoccus sp. I52.16.1]|uniref:CaiB/BaiF CoA transferase family protein n=1 Tax=Acuticoccus sp. I52.16.1 TaxID=2928472 RepID=UPI001FD06AE6|nr:CoA transferase [Acuticoccus sp. I52.16.1]UOM35022.1 CoA transferase [Acuticoccus sp. I52.16.1]